MLGLMSVLLEGTPAPVLGTLATGTADFMTVVGNVITAITGNAVLMACLCAGLIFMAIRFVKRLS